MAESEPAFAFQYLENKRAQSLESKDNQELLLKWSLKGRIKAQVFSFDKQFQSYQKDDFVRAFMQDPCVISNLQFLSSSGNKWITPGMPAHSVTAEQVQCTILSLEFFDRLSENGIVRETGSIVKCLDEFLEDITVSDELRKCLLMDDSDNYDLFSESDRDEFLFRLFKHFCIGGQVCQYEDSIDAYTNITKLVYKDLISVQKLPSTGELKIISHVFKITASDKNGFCYYPSDKDHMNDFAYLVVDPVKRHVTVLYHKFGASAYE